MKWAIPAIFRRHVFLFQVEVLKQQKQKLWLLLSIFFRGLKDSSSSSSSSSSFLDSSTSRQERTQWTISYYFQTYHDLSHLSEKRSHPQKQTFCNIPKRCHKLCYPPTTWWWCLIKNTLYFGRPITKTFIFPSWWSWEGGVPLIPPRTGALLIIISCESPDWVSDADLPGVSLSAGDTRTLVCCFWKKRWTIKIDLYENQNYLYMEFIGLWLNLGWWMIWICLLDIQLKPNLPSACWCKPQVFFHRFLAFPSSWKGGLSDLTDRWCDLMWLEKWWGLCTDPKRIWANKSWGDWFHNFYTMAQWQWS